MKRLIATAIASIGIAASAPASAFVVGGIDFGSASNTHLETATLAETYINGVGQNLTAYGQVTTVNGDTTYCAGNNANCSLYYVLNNFTSSSFFGGKGGQVQFTGGIIDLYYSAAPAINLQSQNSPTNIATIQGMTKWVQLAGHTFADPGFAGTQTLNGFGTLTGQTLSIFGAGQLDVVSGWGNAGVELALDTNTIGDLLGGFADIAFTASSNNFALNPNDAIASCSTQSPNAGAWCLQGTSNIRGTFIPEPGSLALLGLGLASLGFRGRRKIKQ